MITKPFRMIVVGYGAMGSALAQGWLLAGIPLQLTIVSPHRPELPIDYEIDWYPSYDSVPLSHIPDVIILAVKPHILSEVLPLIPQSHVAGSVVISVAAGKNINFYHSYLPAHTAIVKVMPNLPVAFHQGMCVGLANAVCHPEQERFVEILFNALGRFMWLKDEKLFHAVTAVAGCGPAYLFLLEEAMIQAALHIGLAADDAAVMVRQTLLGGLQMLQSQDKSATILKDQVTSAGGVTAAARAVLERPDSGIPSLLIEALEAACQRSKEISHG